MPTTTNIAVTNGDLIPIMGDAGGGVYTAGTNNARDVRVGLLNAISAPVGGAISSRVGVLPRRWTAGESQWLDLKVSGQGSPSTTVTISAGQAVISRSGQGPYLFTLSQDLNVVMDAASGSNPRWDVLGVMGYDKDAIPADAVHGAHIVKVTGDAAGSPAVPTLPTGATEIARILRAAGSNGDLIGSGFTPITDMRRSTSLYGAPRPLMPGDSLTDLGGYNGEIRARMGSFVPTAFANLGIKMMYDYWDAPNTMWRGTNEIAWGGVALTPVTNMGGNQTATLAQVTIPDPGWPYFIEVSGSALQAITGGASTALAGVYLQANIDSTSFTPAGSAIIIRAPKSSVSSPYQLVLPTTGHPTVQTGTHTISLIFRNESNPSNFIDIGANEYGKFNVKIRPA